MLHAEEDQRRHDAEVDISSSGRRTFRLNGKTKRASSVRGLIPCVVFTPEDLRLVKDSAERRRAAIDDVGVQLSATYGRLKSEYEKVVRQRNALLKSEGLSEELLAPWDERLVTLGSKMSVHRAGLFAKIEEKAASIYEELANEQMQSRYVPSWERDGIALSDAIPAEAMERHLELKHREEVDRGITLVGPHRDEIVFTIKGRNARLFGSQGQQRTVALAWKLAEVVVVNEVSGSRPVLLLDDVMSELDEKRRHALAALVGESAQTVMTTTNLDYFEKGMLKAAKVVELP